jgi:microcompartment protein CcmL/EutN
VNAALVLVEVGGWSPGMVILDAMEKAGTIELLQAELNDRPGVMLKLVGPLGDIRSAAEAAEAIARRMQVEIVMDVIPSPAPDSPKAYAGKPDFNPLMEQATVQMPEKKAPEKKEPPFAVGLIETQGFTAVFEAIDTALKTAAVEVLAREKLGGGYITVVIKGDVAAVNAAIEAGKAKVEGLGRLIAAHVIPSPSQGVLNLLPRL